MSNTPSEQSIETLKGVSVATLATALYKRGFRNQVIQDVRPVRAHHNHLPEIISRIWLALPSPCATCLHVKTATLWLSSRTQPHPQRQAIEQCPQDIFW